TRQPQVPSGSEPPRRVASHTEGIAETSTRASAGAAARPYEPVLVYCHISVARVENPIGARIRVMGRSFIAVNSTRAVPVSTPGRASGTVIRARVRAGV